MPAITLATRNVFVYDATGASSILVAGWRQYGTLTNNEFYSCLALCFDQPIPNNFRLMDGSQTILPNDGTILPVGDPITYVPVVLIHQNHLRPRVISGGSPAYPAAVAFRERVRTRDQWCMVSLQDYSQYGFIGQNCCHIIPRSHSKFWVDNQMWQYLTDTNPNQGSNRIDSLQNGILLNNTLHAFWDHWVMSINPNTMMVRIVLDGLERQQYDGRVVQFRPSPDHPAPPPAILHEHWKQFVLANMRGGGEIPSLDYDEQEDSQRMSAFERGEGKLWFETKMLEELSGYEEGNRGSSNGGNPILTA